MEPIVSTVRLRTGLSYEILEWMPADPACEHTLVLLHGYLDLAWSWTRIVETGLFSGYHVLAPTFRGHGRSDWVGETGAYYFFDYIDDLASVVSERARQRISIVGHSMGGTIAAYYAGTYPDRVERLALLEGISVPAGWTGPERLRDAIEDRARARARRGTPQAPGTKRFPTLADAAARMLAYDQQLDPAFALELATRGCLQLSTGEWVYRHDPLLSPRSPIGFEVDVASRFWREVRAHVLYVEGSISPFRLVDPERALRLQAFTGARSMREVLIDGASHMMLRHRAEETAQVLADFLRP